MVALGRVFVSYERGTPVVILICGCPRDAVPRLLLRRIAGHNWNSGRNLPQIPLCGEHSRVCRQGTPKKVLTTFA